MPFLIYAIAAIGLNILVGYCGQVSLGTGGFMAVGAYACYKLMTGVSRYQHCDPFMCLSAGLVTAGVGGVWPAIACGSRGSIWPWPRWRRSSFWSGCSTGCRGSTTIRPRGRFQRRSARYIRRARHRPKHAGLGGLSLLPDVCDLRCAVMARNLTRGIAGAQMDGHSGYGHRRRDHRGEPAEGQADAPLRSARSLSASRARCSSAVYLGAVEVGEVFGITSRSLCCSW